MKKIIPFLFLPLVAFADFDNDDKNRLGAIASNVQTIESNLISNGSFTINPLQSIQYLYRDFTTAFLTSSSSWGGHFIKTVGNAAAKFTQEFGTNGWFPAVKASIGVIQADVGRINTALTDVNTHLELIEGHADSIRDNIASIESSVRDISSDTSSISSSVSDLLTSFSSFWDDSFFGNGYTFFNFRRLKFPKSDSSSGILNASDFQWDEYETDATTPITAIIHLLQGNAQAWEDHFTFTASELMRLSVQQYCIEVLTNTTAQILDTNSFWYAKIYDRIPTNLTVVVSNIASNASNDWSYIASTSLSSAPVLQNLSPDISRDVNQSYALSPPQLTGDFKTDVILLLGNMQQISSSSASVDMDILTNIQVIAGSILSASAEAQRRSNEVQQQAQQIAQEGQSHEHDLDSASEYFRIHDSNPSVSTTLRSFSDLPSSLSPLSVNRVSDNYSIDIPSFSIFGSGSHEPFQVDMDISRYQGYFDNIRSCFALFWFGFAFFIVWKILLLGVRLLGWISSLVNPFSFNAGTKGHDLSSFYG